MISYQILKFAIQNVIQSTFYYGSIENSTRNYMISKKIVFNHSNNVNTALSIFQVISCNFKGCENCAKILSSPTALYKLKKENIALLNYHDAISNLNFLHCPKIFLERVILY